MYILTKILKEFQSIHLPLEARAAFRGAPGRLYALIAFVAAANHIINAASRGGVAILLKATISIDIAKALPVRESLKQTNQITLEY